MAKKKRAKGRAVKEEESVEVEEDGKDPAAKALGKKGGVARAKKLTSRRRIEIAKLAAAARWGN